MKYVLVLILIPLVMLAITGRHEDKIPMWVCGVADECVWIIETYGVESSGGCIREDEDPITQYRRYQDILKRCVLQQEGSVQ